MKRSDPFSGSTSLGSSAFDEKFFDPYENIDPFTGEKRRKRALRQRSPSPEASPPPPPPIVKKDVGARKRMEADTPAQMAALRRNPPIRTEISDREADAFFEQALGKYRRPDPQKTTNNKHLDFYLLDIDYTTPQWISDGSPVIRMFGLSPEGCSVSIYVEGFAPYFFVRVNANLAERIVRDPRKALGDFSTWLNGRAADRDTRPPKNEKQKGRYVRSMKLEKRRSIFGYELEESDFVRIETIQPRHVPILRDILFGKRPKAISVAQLRAAEEEENNHEEEEEDDDPGAERPHTAPDIEELEGRYGVFEVFEADIQYTLNFMVEHNLKGCGWLQLAISDANIPRILNTRTQLEFRCLHHELVSFPDKNDVPAVRIVSYDIECSGLDGRFPIPEEDPVICISVLLYKLQEAARPMVSVGFGVGTIGETKSTKKNDQYVKIEFGKSRPVIDPRTGEWNEDAEIDLLLGFRRFIVEIADADLTSGYNKDNFDDAYFYKRADALGIGQVIRDMSRVKGEIAQVKSSTFSSKAFGTRTDLQARTPGRVSWDVQRVARREMKLRSYTLNYVAGEILGEKKHEISHDRIGPSWLGKDSNPATRRVVLDYNVHDARISYNANAKKLWIWQYQELARATGVTIDTILTRGQGIKTLSQVLRASRAENYTIPTFRDIYEKCDRAGFPEHKHQVALDEMKEAAKLAVVQKKPLPSWVTGKEHKFVEFGPNDEAFLISITEDEGDVSAYLSCKQKVWTSGNDLNARFLRTKKRCDAKGGKAWLVFSEFKGDLNTSRPLYGVAKITGDTADKPPQQWAGSRYRDSPCFSVEWLTPASNLFFLTKENATKKTGDQIDPASMQAIFKMLQGDTKKKKTNADDEEFEEVEGAAYQGAIVIDPILGFYNVPVATLDFSSLYPSIIISWNLDWTTWTNEAQCKKLGYVERPKDAEGRYISVADKDGKYLPELDGHYTITPAGHYFLTKKVREGILPRVLVSLLSRRNIAKAILGVAKDAKKCVAVLREREATAPSEKFRDKLFKALEAGEANKYATAEAKARGTKPEKIDKKEASEAARKVLKEKRSIDPGSAPELVRDVAVAVAREQLNSAVDAIDAKVKQVDPTALGLFDAARQAAKSLPAPYTKESLDALAWLYECYDSYESIFDARQNALKISANSGYGFTGAVVGSLPLKAIAESVTAVGRESIELKRRAIEREFPMPDEMTQEGKLRPIVTGGDTDSIFIIFPGCDTPALAMEWAKKAADWINAKFFTKPMATVFEKIYFPALYIAPKRYCGVYWSKEDKPDEVPKPGADGETWPRIDTKGAESVRRDNYLALSETVGGVLRKILAEGKPFEALKLVAGLVEDIRTNRADLSKLIISKSLSKEPEKYDPIPIHGKLAIRMAQRDAATAPRVGDRVPYLLCAMLPDKNAKISDCGEDPAYVLEHDVSINSDAYIEMLRKPIERILEPVFPGVTKMLFDGGSSMQEESKRVTVSLETAFLKRKVERVDEVLDPTSEGAKKLAKKKKVRERSDHEPSNRTLEWARSKSRIEMKDVRESLMKFIAEKRKLAPSELGSAIKKRFVTTTSTASPLLVSGLTRVLPKCLSCDASVDCSACGKDCDCERIRAAALCTRCAKIPGESERRKKRIEDEAKEARAKNGERWKVCEDCVGSVEEAEDCAYKECSNWFARADSRKDLKRCDARLERFTI